MTIQRFSSLSKANPHLFAEQGCIHSLLSNGKICHTPSMHRFSYRQPLSDAATLMVDVLSGQLSLNNIRYGTDDTSTEVTPAVATLMLPPNQRIYIDDLGTKSVYCVLEHGNMELSGWPLRESDSVHATNIQQLVIEAIGTDALLTLIIDNQQT